MRSIALSFFCCLLILSTSCKTELLHPDINRQGYDFYPLQTGIYRIYQVNTINYTNTGQIEKDSFLLKELLIDSFPNQAGHISYVLQISTKSFEDNLWLVDSVWLAERTTNGILVMENNIPYLKLSFPVEFGKVWNGNAFNSSSFREYEITALDEDVLTVEGDTVFKNALEVVQLDIPGPIVAKQYKREVFGRAVGMLYKENIYIDYDSATQSNIDFGFEYRQKIIEFGKE